MLRAGLIGFPSTGKTALFQLLTSAREAPRSGGKSDANVGVSRVPDERLDKLTALFNPRKRVPATVEFAANAQYTGLAATPKATVTLNGKQLQQDADFRVVPQKDAVEVTAADSKPYTATVQGIGAYSGEAGSFAYGIDKGDLANCTVTFDTKVFNWTAQEPAATGVHVKNAVRTVTTRAREGRAAGGGCGEGGSPPPSETTRASGIATATAVVRCV